MTTIFLASAIALTFLQAFDGWTTYQILKNGGRELNPIVKFLMDKLGRYPGLLVLKAAAAALAWVVALVPIADVKSPDVMSPDVARLVALGVMAAFYSWAAVNNWRVLQRQEARKEQPPQ